MSRRLLPLLAVALTSALPVVACADEPSDEAKAIAVKVTGAGAMLFDAKDAKGLAATYTDDARLDVISEDKETGSLKIETRQGRPEIEAYYERLFEGDQRPHAKNTVEYARRVGSDLLVIAGVFVPDTEAADPLRLPFTQVRAKKDGVWKIVSLQVIIPSGR